MVPEEEEEEEETPLFPVHGHIRCSFCMCDVHFYSLQHRPRPKNVENGSINFKRPYKKNHFVSQEVVLTYRHFSENGSEDVFDGRSKFVFSHRFI